MRIIIDKEDTGHATYTIDVPGYELDLEVAANVFTLVLSALTFPMENRKVVILDTELEEVVPKDNHNEIEDDSGECLTWDWDVPLDLETEKDDSENEEDTFFNSKHRADLTRNKRKCNF